MKARTKHIDYLLLLLIVPFIIGCGTEKESMKVDERPNIIIFLIDDSGYADLGSYGSEISTPNIDKLASSGIKFMYGLTRLGMGNYAFYHHD